MRSSFCLLLILCTCISSTAQFRITAIDGPKDTHYKDHSFPLVRGGNKMAAEKINQALQMELLRNDSVQTDARRIFQNAIFIADDNAMPTGLMQISYEVVLNNGRVLSLKFTVETMGAYPESYYRYYSFHAGSGEPVLAKDIFTTEGIDYIKKHLVDQRAERIKKLLKENEYEPEDSVTVRETFAGCNEDPQEDYLFIRPNDLLFYKEYCFPHVWRAMDDNLDMELQISFVRKYLSEAGRKLLLK